MSYSNFPVRKKAAIEKYIISPDTSTKVATKGADAVAGSIPNLRNMNGIIDPDNVPQRTMKSREIDTLKPI